MVIISAYINEFLKELELKRLEEESEYIIEKGIFYLMNKDNKVIKFTVKDSLINRYEVIDVYNKKLLPVLMRNNLEYLQTWLDNRVIPTNRVHLQRLLESINKTDADRFSLLIENHACSLNDTFWIKRESEINPINNMELQWKDVSLYKGFKESLGMVTFFGNTSSLGGRLRSPEITGQGALSKAWRIVDRDIILYKRGTEIGVNSGNEPYSELIASKIAVLCNINHVRYNLDRWNGILCSTCKLYTTEDIGYIPMSEYLESEYSRSTPWTFDKVLKIIPKEFVQEFYDMIVFDYIIENEDRHFNNFGLLVDNNTMDIIGFMPLFDNGFSLLTLQTKDDLEYYDFNISSIGTFLVSNRTQATEIIKINKERYKHWSKEIMTNLDYIIDKEVPEYRMRVMLKLIVTRCNYINRL